MTKLGALRRGSSASGMTLLEVMVVVAVSTMVLGTVVSLAIALKQTDRNIRLADVESRRLIELAEMIRTDIRAGNDVSLSTNNLLVIATAGGGERRYELGLQGCRRNVILPDEAQPRSDLFLIGPAKSWTIEKGAPGIRPLFIATLNRPDASEGITRRRMPLVVYAALGADLPPATAAVAE